MSAYTLHYQDPNRDQVQCRVLILNCPLDSVRTWIQCRVVNLGMSHEPVEPAIEIVTDSPLDLGVIVV